MLGQVGQSPLGAFIESPLGVRTVESDAAPNHIVVVSQASQLHIFRATDLEMVFGPQTLSHSQSGFPESMCFNNAFTRFYGEVGNRAHAWNLAGSKLWDASVSAAGVAFDETYVYTLSQAQPGGAGTAITLSLDVRSAATGTVLDTFDLVTNSGPTFFAVAGEGMAARFDGTYWQIYVLTSAEVADRTFEYTLHKLRAGAPTPTNHVTLGLGTFDTTTAVVVPLHVVPGNSYLYTGRFSTTLGENIRGLTARNPSTLAVVAAGNLDSGDDPEYRMGAQVDSGSSGEVFSFEARGGLTTTVSKQEADGTLVLNSSDPITNNVGDIAVRPGAAPGSGVEIAEVADELVPVAAYSKQLSATGSPTLWALDISPHVDATISASGLVSWTTLSKTGSPHTFRARAQNATAWDSEEWVVTVLDTAPVINAIADENRFPTVPYSKQPTLSAGDSPITWTLEAGPAGATINASTGEVAWTDTDTPGDYDFTVRATNIIGFDEESWTVTILDLGP